MENSNFVFRCRSSRNASSDILKSAILSLVVALNPEDFVFDAIQQWSETIEYKLPKPPGKSSKNVEKFNVMIRVLM